MIESKRTKIQIKTAFCAGHRGQVPFKGSNRPSEAANLSLDRYIINLHAAHDKRNREIGAMRVATTSSCQGTVSQFSTSINQRHPGASNACYGIALHFAMEAIGALSGDHHVNDGRLENAAQIDTEIAQGLSFWGEFMPRYARGGSSDHDYRSIKMHLGGSCQRKRSPLIPPSHCRDET